MIKPYKKENNISYALGATVTMELLKYKPDCVTRIYVSPKCTTSEVVDFARQKNVEVVESEKAFNVLSPKENCFVIGEFNKYSCELNDNRSHIVLVNPSNSGNLGTIMRCGLAFNCPDIAIITPAVDHFDPKTIRASMGAIFSCNVARFDSFSDYSDAAGNREFLAFTLDGKNFNDFNFAHDMKYSLIFGNEATGLPQEFNKYNCLKIEQSDKVDSLNLSVAAAIALYKMNIRR